MSWLAVGSLAVGVVGKAITSDSGSGSAAGGALDGGTGDSNLAAVGQFKDNAQAGAGMLKGGFDQQLAAFQAAAAKLDQLYAGQFKGDTADLQSAFSAYAAGKNAGLDRYVATSKGADAAYTAALQKTGQQNTATAGTLGQVYGSNLGAVGTNNSNALGRASINDAGTLRGAATDYAGQIQGGVAAANSTDAAAAGRSIDRLAPTASAGDEALGRLKATSALDPATLTDDQQHQLTDSKTGWLQTLNGSELRGAGRAGIGTVMKAEGDQRDQFARENRSRADAATAALFSAGQGANTATNALDTNAARYQAGNVLQGAQLVGGNNMATEGRVAGDTLSNDRTAAANALTLGKSAADANLTLGTSAMNTTERLGEAGAAQDLKGGYARGAADTANTNDVSNQAFSTWLKNIGVRDAYAGKAGALIGAEGSAIGDTAVSKAQADADAQTSWANLLTKTQFQNNADRGKTMGWLGSVIGNGAKAAFKGSGSSSSSGSFDNSGSSDNSASFDTNPGTSDVAWW